MSHNPFWWCSCAFAKINGWLIPSKSVKVNTCVTASWFTNKFIHFSSWSGQVLFVLKKLNIYVTQKPLILPSLIFNVERINLNKFKDYKFKKKCCFCTVKPDVVSAQETPTSLSRVLPKKQQSQGNFLRLQKSLSQTRRRLPYNLKINLSAAARTLLQGIDTRQTLFRKLESGHKLMPALPEGKVFIFELWCKATLLAHAFCLQKCYA